MNTSPGKESRMPKKKARFESQYGVIGGMERASSLALSRLNARADTRTLRLGLRAPAVLPMTIGSRSTGGQEGGSDISYHGGSRRGGYGPDSAAEVVSTQSATRAERWILRTMFGSGSMSTGRQYGIGRPYLDRDPPHIGAQGLGTIHRPQRGVKWETRGS